MENKNDKLEEFNLYIRNRKVAIISLEKDKLPLLEYLYKKNAKVTIFDKREIDEIPKDIMDTIAQHSMEFSFGSKYFNKLEGFDIIIEENISKEDINKENISKESIKTKIIEEENRGAIVTTEIELIMKIFEGKIIGVTGDEAKETIEILKNILEYGHYKCYSLYNKSISLFGQIEEMVKEDILIVELNKMQLKELQVSPNIAVITNIRDKNEEDDEKDWQDIKNIFKYQSKQDILVVNIDNKKCKDFENETEAKVIFYSTKQKLDNGFIMDNGVIKECEDKVRKHILNTKDMRFLKIRNLENACVAIAVARNLVDIDTIVEAMKL